MADGRPTKPRVRAKCASISLRLMRVAGTRTVTTGMMPRLTASCTAWRLRPTNLAASGIVKSASGFAVGLIVIRRLNADLRRTSKILQELALFADRILLNIRQRIPTRPSGGRIIGFASCSTSPTTTRRSLDSPWYREADLDHRAVQLEYRVCCHHLKHTPRTRHCQDKYSGGPK